MKKDDIVSCVGLIPYIRGHGLCERVHEGRLSFSSEASWPEVLACPQTPQRENNNKWLRS